MVAASHYEVLGVAPDASTATIREAYRQRARDHHPDRQTAPGRDGAADRPGEMAAINEAYRVLSDPARRVVYDSSLRGTGSAARSSPSPASDPEATDWESEGWSGARPGVLHPSHLGPARVPWRMLLLSGGLAIVAVVVLAQFTEPGPPPSPDGILRVGSCVALEPNGDAREVNCISDAADDSPSDDLVVAAFIPFDATCPGGTEPHRDRQGMGVACIALPD